MSQLVRRGKKDRRLGAPRGMEWQQIEGLDSDARVELIKALVPLGLAKVGRMLDAEVTRLAGQRHPVWVPRVREAAGEVPLVSYAALLNIEPRLRAACLSGTQAIRKERRCVAGSKHVRRHAAGQLLDLFPGLVTGDSRGVVDERRDYPGFVDVGLSARVRELPVAPNPFGQLAQPCEPDSATPHPRGARAQPLPFAHAPLIPFSGEQSKDFGNGHRRYPLPSGYIVRTVEHRLTVISSPPPRLGRPGPWISRSVTGQCPHGCSCRRTSCRHAVGAGGNRQLQRRVHWCASSAVRRPAEHPPGSSIGPAGKICRLRRWQQD